jgi:hypothetical protein
MARQQPPAGPALQLPWMRDEALQHLRALSDTDAQVRWGQAGSPLDGAVHFLFDDRPAPADALGYYLGTAAEVEAMRAVAAALDALLERHGVELGDRDYVTRPEWTEVVRAARAALDLLRDGR